MKQQAESHSEIVHNRGVEMTVRHTKNYFHKGLTKMKFSIWALLEEIKSKKLETYEVKDRNNKINCNSRHFRSIKVLMLGQKSKK